VIVDGLTSIVVDRGIEPQSGQTKDYKLVFISSQLKNHAALRSKRYGVRAKTDLLGTRIMFPSGVIY
jgi:hypothetical protein